MVNVNEFYAAGLGFTICDEDAAFDASGELVGYSTADTRAEFTPDEDDGCGYENRYFSTSEGLTDTTTLSDDHGRWEHVRDGHLLEMEEVERAMAPRWNDGKRDEFREREFWQAVRQRRTDELARCLARAKRQRNWKRVKAVRDGVRERYIKSVKLVVERDRGEWGELLYLTKVQYAQLMG